MIRPLAFCVGMVLFWAASSQGALAADTPECSLNRLATVKTVTLRDGRIKVPVTLEGHPLSFLVDTGGVITTVKWEQARQMGLPVKQNIRQLVGVGGSMLNFSVTGENFLVGDLRVKNRPIYVESRALPDVDGTLAADILRGYDVEFDFGHDTLSLVSSDHCAGQVVDWTTTGFVVMPIDVEQSGHIRFPVKVNGTTIMATLDTGSMVSLINMKTAVLLGIDPKAPEMRLLRNDSNYQIYTYPFQSLEFGKIAVKNPRIVIASDGFIPTLNNDLVLGIETLRQMHLYIAYGEKRLYMTGAQAN